MHLKGLATSCGVVLAATFAIAATAQQVQQGSVAHDKTGTPIYLHQHVPAPTTQSVPAIAQRRVETAKNAATPSSKTAGDIVLKVVPEAFVSTNPTVDCGPGVLSQGNGGQVTAAWDNGIGLPVDAANQQSGLFLSKELLTTDCSAGVANIKGLSAKNSIFLSELGFDVDSAQSAPSGYGVPAAPVEDKPLHCGAGAPRFNIGLVDGSTFAFACSYGTHTRRGTVGGAVSSWDTVRFGDTDAFFIGGGPTAVWPGFGNAHVDFIQIVFDEGTDQGSGQTIIDNIDVNGFLIGSSAGVDIQQ